MSIFGSFSEKVHLLCYKLCEEIFFFFFFYQLRVSFDILKSILYDVIVGLNTQLNRCVKCLNRFYTTPVKHMNLPTVV